MAISINKDLIRDSGCDEQFDPFGILFARKIDRVFYVQGLPVDSDVGKASIPTQAIDYVKLSAAPIMSSHPLKTECLARTYRFIAQPDPSGGEVVVSYVFERGTYTPGEYTIDCTGGLQQTTTDSEFDQTNKLVPIKVKYLEYAEQGRPVAATWTPLSSTGTNMPVLRPIGGLLLRKQVGSDKLAAIENARGLYLGYTNQGLFRGMPQNTYLCSAITTTSSPRTGTYIASAEWSYRPETWDEWARFHSDHLGTPHNIWRDITDGYTQNNSNGYKRCKAYPLVNMQTLFNLIVN